MGTKPKAVWTEFRLGKDAGNRKYFTKIHFERDASDEVALYIEGTIVKSNGRLSKVEGRTLVDVVEFGPYVNFREIVHPANGWTLEQIGEFADIATTFNSAMTGTDTHPIPPWVTMFLWEHFGMVAPG